MKFKPSLHIYVDYDNVSIRQVILSIPKLLNKYTLKSINLVAIQERINTLVSRNIIDYVSQIHNCKINCYGVETSSNNADIKLASICCIKHSRKSKSKIIIISSDNGFKELKSTLESIGRNVQIINADELKKLSCVEQSDQLLKHKLLDMFVNEYKKHNIVTIQTIDRDNTDEEYQYHKRLAMTSKPSFCKLLQSLDFNITANQQISGFSTIDSKIPINLELSTFVNPKRPMSKQLVIKTSCNEEDKSLITQELLNWTVIDKSNKASFFNKFKFVLNSPFQYEFSRSSGTIVFYSEENANEKFYFFKLNNNTSQSFNNLNDILNLIFQSCVKNISLTSSTSIEQCN